MDADTHRAFERLNAKVDNLTSLNHFLIARVLLLMNDVQSLRTVITNMAAQVSTIAGGLASQGSQLGDIQAKVSAENTAIGTLGADVQAVADLVEKLRSGNVELPQDVFDQLGTMQTQLAAAAAAAQESSSSLQTIASSISSASNAVTQQATALVNVVTPPAPQPAPVG